jgi:hypothetical protein
MDIITNQFEGMYAVPIFHPVTCLNPAPWKITQMKLEKDFELGVKVWIRGEESSWFRVDQCFCDTESDCKDYINFKTG